MQTNFYYCVPAFPDAFEFRRCNIQRLYVNIARYIRTSHVRVSEIQNCEYKRSYVQYERDNKLD